MLNSEKQEVWNFGRNSSDLNFDLEGFFFNVYLM
jgi:hypothetical protein